MKPIFNTKFSHIIELLILAFLFAVLILNVISFFQSVDNQKELVEYQKNSENKIIEDWMTLQFIAREFKIKRSEINEIFEVELNNKDYRTPIDKICKDKKLECEIIIVKLNEKANNYNNNKNSQRGNEE
jgi:hypothetical protein